MRPRQHTAKYQLYSYRWAIQCNLASSQASSKPGSLMHGRYDLNEEVLPGNRFEVIALEVLPPPTKRRAYSSTHAIPLQTRGIAGHDLGKSRRGAWLAASTLYERQ